MEVPTSKVLGGLKKESEGILFLLKPKLYVMFSKERQREILQQGDIREYLKRELNTMEMGKDIVKYASHGFQGDVFTLLNLIAESKYVYSSKEP